MKRHCVALLIVFFLFLLPPVVSSQSKTSPGSSPAMPSATPKAASNAARDVDDGDDDDPDIPPMARGRISKEDYLRMRDQQVGMQRGVNDLLRNPQARSRAIRAMEAQEQALRRRKASAKASNPGSQPWMPLGPDPIPNGQTFNISAPVSGRVTAIAIDPTDLTGNTAYVGTAQGGLYRTLDGGNTWTAMMDSAQSLAIGALTLDPTDHTVLFVGTGEGNLSLDSFFGVGLYIITNANSGFTLNGPFNTPTVSPDPDGFSDVFTGRSITRILVNPGNHSQILVSTTSGFSGASGGSFSTLPTRGVYLSTNVFSSGSTVGSPTFSRLTIQSGAANEIVTDMTMDPGNSNQVLVHVFGQVEASDGGAWASSTSPSPWSGNATWTQVLTENSNNGKFAVNRSSGGTPVTTFLLALNQTPATGVCAGTGSGGTLSRATAASLTSWTELTAARGFCGGQCFYDMPVAMDPTNASNIYIGGQAGGSIGSCGSGTLGKSTDGGNTFNSNTSNFSETALHADSHAIAILPSNPNIVYTGNDGGIFRSVDGGMTWSSLNTAGFTATQFESIAVHPTDPNFTIGGTQDNGTPFLMPDGVTWTLADFGDGGFSAIDQNAPDTTNVTMYHTYFNETGIQIGFAQVTSVANAQGGGWNFFGCGGFLISGINCSDSVLFYAPLALGPGNPNTVYFGTDTLYRSPDQGNTLLAVSQAPIVPNVPISAIGISPLSDNIRLVGLSFDQTTGLINGHAFLTTTGSSTLTDVTGPWTPRYIARTVIDPNNPNTAYITLDGYGVPTGHVWKTTNLLAATPTWMSMSNGIPDVPVNGFVVDAQNSNNLYAGTDIGAYNSTDGGNTWNPYGVGLPRVAVFDLKITAKRTVRIATHGRGMWEIAAVTPGVATTTALSFTPSNPGTSNLVTFTAVVNHTSGSPVPTGTVVFVDSGTVLGFSSLNSAATATFSTTMLAAGQHSITTAYTGDSTYAASQASPVPLNVIATDFTLNIPSSSAMVMPGQSAMYTINVSPVNGFSGAISFSCTSGLPQSASCSFNPAILMGSGSTALTISTTAPTAAPPSTGSSAAGLGTGVGFGLFGLALFGVLYAGKKQRSLRLALMMLAILGLSVAVSSCGSKTTTTPNPGTPGGTFNVMVTAASGADTHTATVTLTVQ